MQPKTKSFTRLSALLHFPLVALPLSNFRKHPEPLVRVELVSVHAVWNAMAPLNVHIRHAQVHERLMKIAHQHIAPPSTHQTLHAISRMQEEARIRTRPPRKAHENPHTKRLQGQRRPTTRRLGEMRCRRTHIHDAHRPHELSEESTHARQPTLLEPPSAPPTHSAGRSAWLGSGFCK